MGIHRKQSGKYPLSITPILHQKKTKKERKPLIGIRSFSFKSKRSFLLKIK